MQKFILLVVFTILMSFAIQVRADHVVGGEITYKHVSTLGNNSTYDVEIVIFGDCSGNSFPSYTATSSIQMWVYQNGTLYATHSLPKVASESDILISEVCPTAINQTTCSGGNIIGIKKFTYRASIILNGVANWKFTFFDFGGSGSQSAGRSLLPDNISNPGFFYIEATLDNSNGSNNSPTFASNPVPFFCYGIPSSFEVSAIDTDGDSLVYSLEPVLQNPLGTGAITYNPGYSYIQPLNVVPGSFSFSTQTGVAEFIPNASSWEGIVVNKVTEYRNGIMIGSVMREMMFVYLANCQNQAPVTNINNVSNGQMLSSSTTHSISFNTCSAQQGVFGFDVAVSDPEMDNITITSNNLPSGANINILNNGTTNPIVSFSWAVGTATPGTYHFYITYTDDGCPLASVKTVVYIINIQPFEGLFALNQKVPCRDDSNAMAWILPDASNTSSFSYTWLDLSFNILKPTTGLQIQGDTLFNVYAGSYLVQVHNTEGCMQQFAITIDSPIYKAYFETDSIVCINTPLQFNPNYTNNDFDTWEWDFGNGQTSNLQFPQVQYSNAGSYTIQLIGTTAMGCKDTFEQTVIVDSIMRPEFELNRNEICVGESIDITAFYGNNVKTAKWNFGDGGSLSVLDSAFSYAYPQAGSFEIEMNVDYRACSDVGFSRNVRVHDYPKVDLGSDTGLCYQGNPIELKNLEGNQQGDRFKWNSGAITESIYASHHGILSLTVTRNDCSTTDSIDIKKDCYIDIPNAFIPGSGVPNGYFFPRSILSKGVSQFSMTIYNRWGQIIFQTNNPDGSGWDGNYNGQPQPQGVYVYQIDVTYRDGKSEKYQGNVTLLR